MDWLEKNRFYFRLVWIISIFFYLPICAFSQTQIKGRVVYKKDNTPAANSTIQLLREKEGVVSDKYGNFSIHIPVRGFSDTIQISSVGFETLRIPVYAALKRSEFGLTEKTKNLENVTVFNTHQVIGSTSESVGYYRSWRHENTGGEIGRIFSLPYDKFKIDKIRFKAGNLCDTCLLRLHIREVVDGEPGDEIVDDSISLFVNKLSLDSKIPEFDLTPFDITFTESEFFVGIEILNCTNGTKGVCSFNFAGTEKGKYFFKSSENAAWQSTDDYTIYLKLFLRY